MSRKAAGFWRRFLPLLAIGFVGIAVVGLEALRVIERVLVDAPPQSRPPWLLMIATALLQPAMALLVSAGVGALLAHRFGLVSVVAHRQGWDRFRSGLLIAFGAGILAGGACIAADRLLFGSLLPEFFAGARKLAHPPLNALLIGVFFGGITEEIVMRWGVMTLSIFLLSLLRRATGPHRSGSSGLPPPVVYWTSIGFAALVFAAAHLPSAATIAPLTEMAIARILLLNTVAGAIFGWLFWRYTLESAMVAHAALHIVFFAAAVGGVS